MCGAQHEQFALLLPPPGLPGCGLGDCRAIQLFPGRPQHSIVCRLADCDIVQLGNQPVALLFINDKGEIQIVGGLCQQVDLVLFEQFEGIAQLMQDRSNTPAHQADGRTRTNDFDAADLGEIRHQRLHRRLVQRVGCRIERYRDIGFRGGNQIYRQAMRLEHLKGIREKAH